MVEKEEKEKNCKKKNICPMENKCLTSNIIYEVTVTNNTNMVEKIYFGLCETSFKERYHNHTGSFRLQNVVKIQNYLNMYGNQKMKLRFPLLSGEF